jgi:tRNA threonylcarbamoyladenosine biosynthesis protein TsaB
MRLLAIESSGQRLSLGLFEAGELVLELGAEAAMRQNETMAPLVQELCLKASWKPSQIEAVAVSQGPGSFTGLRTALAFAKGLNFATGAKLLGVPTLSAWAEGEGDAEVWLDARRGMIYRGAYSQGRETKQPCMMDLRQAQSELAKGSKILGDLPEFRTPGGPASLSVRRVGAVALRRLAQGDWDDPAALEPIYLRRPEAEILWEKLHGA